MTQHPAHLRRNPRCRYCQDTGYIRLLAGEQTGRAVPRTIPCNHRRPSL